MYLVHSGDLNLALDNKEEEEEGGNNDEEKEEDKTNNIQNIQIRSILFSTGEPCKDRLILTAINPPSFLEIPPQNWKRVQGSQKWPPRAQKSDRHDPKKKALLWNI